MKHISIVGFGRFGRVLYRLLKDDFLITLYDIHPIEADANFTQNTIVARNLVDVYQNEVIFYAVPIAAFSQVIAEHKSYFRDNQVLIDVLSVKTHPQQVFTTYLKGMKTQALLTHPMFGPDSSQIGFTGLPLVMDKFMTSDTNYQFWKHFFIQKGLHVVELGAKEHDKLAARSQGVTHFIGRLLDELSFAPTEIDTLGAKKLYEVQQQTCHDTWELFQNLQNYNPYTQAMRVDLGKAYDMLYNQLLPKRVHHTKTVFGIQGGKGSFNEAAIRYYIEREGIGNFVIKYLYTTENVLKALYQGKIDRGQFAIHNSIGGIVDESIQALAAYRCQVVDKYAIKIAHALMMREDAEGSDITTIMTHPQVLAQCKQTLSQKYPNFIQTSGSGRLIDHALVAKQLGEKKLPKHIATMGSNLLAKLYQLKVVEDNLQDAQENYTSFLLVSRYGDI